MGKGFYISKTLGIVGIVIGAGAVATIIALSVVYSQEKSKNNEIENQQTTTTKGPTTNVPATTNIPTTVPSNEPWDQWRLPQTLSPETYKVTLWPRLQKNAEGLYIFTGDSSVVFRCVENTDLILIHSNKLTIKDSTTLKALGGNPAPNIVSTKMYPKTQYMAIWLDRELTAGESYELYTEFVGELSDDLGGFYRSEYYDENGVLKVVATTQMQATDARKAFPCFDEPAMKAVFNIVLLHDPGTVALSNGVVIEEIPVTVDGISLTKTTFAPTEKMSTYLLAFIVSEFTYIEQKLDDLQIRIFARKEAIDANQGEYALSVTGKILRFFEEYYNSSYPLPKSDQIALPDFNAGAMENWGLITYRETALLYDEEMSSNGNKERVVTVIAHELAHQWFGNLVTIRWWNDLWLNEGFASYVEYLGADEAEPLWNIKDLIVLNDVHRVFAIDALASSHPLSSKEEDVQRPEQISEVFDTISYSKGASVLRMLSNFLSEDVFTQGLRTYLEHFKFNNTVYTDLWDHLQMAVDETGTELPRSVKDIMDRWVLQMGFPVVTINTVTGQISQEHFLLDPETKPEPSEFNYEWFVPITWTKNEAIKPQYWLLQKNTQFDDMKTNANEWVLANINTVGYYRVNYDEQNWERLLNALQTSRESIPVINRAQLIDDAFNLAKAGIIKTTLALRTTEFLDVETEYMPWQSALNNLDYFYLMFDRSEVYGHMQAYIRKQVTPLFEYFTELTDWQGVPDNHTEQYNQVNALRVACSIGLKNCTDLVTSWFGEWMNNEDVNPIHANLRSTVYCSAIAAGGAEEWEFAWKMFEKTSVASEKDKLRAAMACATQPWLLNRYLEYTLDANKIRKQDATSTIVSIASNVGGQSLAWDFVRANWEYIFNQYGGGSFSFSNLINGVTKRFSTEFELKQLMQFKEDNEHIGFGSGSLAIQQSIERTKANIKWVEQNKADVLQWFKDQSKP
ncbi:alanyl (membrane) aminopeptidase b, tandem duplicate 1 [Danio rerio]|uniref:Aminopeptidase n=1 Tax=Danio rerio TaxID=7955 RepID=A4FUN4_DANRE|nr:alanyl (membrane) aminopeptidase b, tandem duplicate 1 [Danio rerio]AAI15261.1 Zgc:136771 protein [Danio rerio]AAI54245.1 Zgc:136771 [Danio rerio]|eukprot:NP_001082794.1 aminopeptidase N [Danio rerio]